MNYRYFTVFMIEVLGISSIFATNKGVNLSVGFK
ncbi:hypothetical protein ECH_0863 [Ehrlichia chaffeensis str. Arkansas]|uniref:Uncharacterized protein n=1 Tax=Ehrlichia chaffeensis (strain ATCC CRL-10679 / Arkansas) TaxID=205920 RepID=Q2GFX5_EHRCR|nr:hypothetical protein ECH_0863 [Ehrlichia chaffeensis str. Arkansas]